METGPVISIYRPTQIGNMPERKKKMVIGVENVCFCIKMPTILATARFALFNNTADLQHSYIISTNVLIPLHNSKNDVMFFVLEPNNYVYKCMSLFHP